MNHASRHSILRRVTRLFGLVGVAVVLVATLPSASNAYVVDEGGYDSYCDSYDGCVDLGYTVEQDDGATLAAGAPMCAIDPDTGQCITDPCRTARVRNWAKRRVDGGLIYQIVNEVAFCFNGSSITYFSPRHYIDYCCGFLWHFRNWENLSTTGGVGSTQAQNFVQAKFEACEQWCYKELHPWSNIVVNATGEWTWSRGGS